MCEVNFKAWDGNKVCGVKNIEFAEDGVIITKDDGYFGYLGSDIKLLQYTGLKDKNEVEVYEGDICKYFMDDIWKYGVVERSQGGFALQIFRMEGKRKTCYALCKFQSFIPVPDAGNIMEDQFEVISNIYDNPELLET